jgi:hypothetical protein
LSSGAISTVPSPSQLSASAADSGVTASSLTGPLDSLVYSTVLRHRHLGLPVAQRHRRVELRQAELLGRRGLLGHLQERVVVQHLVDFLAELQRRELQQPDRLLQLRRQRQVLGDAERQPRFHGHRAVTS